MAIAALPIAKIYLVGHVGGGAILHAGGGYVANTMLPAAVVEGFSAASSALATIGASAASLAANPYVVAGTAIAVVAVGTYSYFYGVPAPIEAALINAGLAEPAKQGLLIGAAKLATGLVLLGLAGLVSYNFYKRVKEARTASKSQEVIEVGAAKATAEAAFGHETWNLYGKALWDSVNDTATQVAEVANRILGSIRESTANATSAFAKPVGSAKQHLTDFWVGVAMWLKRRSS